MSSQQYDMFSNEKTTDEIQLDLAIALIESYGYRVVKNKEEIRDLAIDAGYKVTEPIIVDEKIITLKDLRNYFYKKLWEKHPELATTHVELPWAQQMRAVKLFVESRQELGLNKKNAIQECVSIIDTIFEHEEEFNFNRPIDISILGQKKASWITAKAVYILNNKLNKVRERKVDQLIEKLDEDHEVNLNKKSKQLDILLSNIEGETT